MEVDDEERQDDAVSERVDDAADLEEPDVVRQLRVEPAEETHRRNLAGQHAPHAADPGERAAGVSLRTLPSPAATGASGFSSRLSVPAPSWHSVLAFP